MFNHADWVRCLGNALTRTLLAEGGGDLFAELVKQGYAYNRKRMSLGVNGMEIVRAAFDAGKLLTLARDLKDWGYESQSSASFSIYQRSPFSEDTRAIAHSLLEWHALLLSLVEPSGAQTPQ